MFNGILKKNQSMIGVQIIGLVAPLIPQGYRRMVTEPELPPPEQEMECWRKQKEMLRKKEAAAAAQVLIWC